MPVAKCYCNAGYILTAAGCELADTHHGCKCMAQWGYCKPGHSNCVGWYACSERGICKVGWNLDDVQRRGCKADLAKEMGEINLARVARGEKQLKPIFDTCTYTK